MPRKSAVLEKEAPGNTGSEQLETSTPALPPPQAFKPSVRETIWTQDGPTQVPDAQDVAQAAVGIITRNEQTAKLTYVSDPRVRDATVQRIGPGRVPMYDLQDNGRLIHKQSMVALLRLGFTLQCKSCGGEHIFVDQDGKRWFDTSPNACPAKPKRNYTACPICPEFMRRKIVYDIRPTKDQETWKTQGPESLFIPDDQLPIKSTLYGVLSSHVWAKHPDEARIYRWAEPPKAPTGSMNG